MALQSTTIRVHGQDYTIRSDHDPDYVQRIAHYLDARMNEVASETSQVTSLRVAILAALNITDELFVERGGEQGGVDALQERARRMIARLDEIQEIGEASGA